MVAANTCQRKTDKSHSGWNNPTVDQANTGTDEELLARYRDAGDRPAFDRLVRRYERELTSYLRRYLGDTQMAEDVLQGTFLQLHLKRHQFEHGKRFRPWLYAVATNQAIDSQRRNRRHRVPSLDHAGPENEEGGFARTLPGRETSPYAEAEAEERRSLMHQAIRELPERLRTVIDLVYFQGFKYRDAARFLGVPLGTVKSRMHEAVELLSGCWRRAVTSRKAVVRRNVADARVAI
jgi:RNA polymerase sigma-70 factor (ECF subfamily)